MSVSFTLSTLKTAIQERAEDTGSQFAASLDVIIQLGETRILRDLPLSIWQIRDSVPVVQGTNTATKPNGTIAMHKLHYTDGNGQLVNLKPRTVTYCEDYAPNTTEGTPKYYAEEYSETLLLIAPNPNISTTATALITKRPTSLVIESGGTFISQKLGDLLLAACMAAAEEYDVAPELVAMWEKRYTTAFDGAAKDMAHLLPRNYTGMAAAPSAIGKMER